MKKNILLITHSRDYYNIDLVTEAVIAGGHTPIRFNTDGFPQEIMITIGVDPADTTITLPVGESAVTLGITDIPAVWLRKLGGPYVDEDMDPQIRQGCLRESAETMDVFLNQLTHPGTFWIDARPNIDRANDKVYQLITAKGVGLNVPETIVCNDPEKVRAFYRRLKGDVVSKMLTPFSVSMNGNTPFVYTNRLKPEDLEELDSLCYSPMIFQQAVNSRLECRVAYVDGVCHTGALATGEILEGDVDWRKNKQEQQRLQWQDHRLPDDVSDKIRVFMNKVGLHFGALDLILDDKGRYYFLEVNPNGEWGMLERDLELPISKAIADALIKRV